MSHIRFKKHNTDKKIYAQSSGGETPHLLHSEETPPLFQLKPDLCIKDQGKTIIADTKWKPLKNAEDKKHGIAQSDLYQVFAYAHYHQASEVWLIYPKLYDQKNERDKKDAKMKEIVKNLEKWNYHYKHELFEDRKIEVKILFAPLAFH